MPPLRIAFAAAEAAPYAKVGGLAAMREDHSRSASASRYLDSYTLAQKRHRG